MIENEDQLNYYEKFKIIFFFISYIINAKDINTDEILKSIYNGLIDNTGTKIESKKLQQ